MATNVTSLERNGMAERIIQTLKRDYAKLANRLDSKTGMIQLKDWLDDYNSYRQHSSIF